MPTGRGSPLACCRSGAWRCPPSISAPVWGRRWNLGKVSVEDKCRHSASPVFRFYCILLHTEYLPLPYSATLWYECSVAIKLLLRVLGQWWPIMCRMYTGFHSNISLHLLILLTHLQPSTTEEGTNQWNQQVKWLVVKPAGKVIGWNENRHTLGPPWQMLGTTVLEIRGHSDFQGTFKQQMFVMWKAISCHANDWFCN